MKCPNCKIDMAEIETWEDADDKRFHESISLFQCGKCKGIKTVRL